MELIVISSNEIVHMLDMTNYEITINHGSLLHIPGATGFLLLNKTEQISLPIIPKFPESGIRSVRYITTSVAEYLDVLEGICTSRNIPLTIEVVYHPELASQANRNKKTILNYSKAI